MRKEKKKIKIEHVEVWYHLAWRGEEEETTKKNKRAKKGMGGEAGVVGKHAALRTLRKLLSGTQNGLFKSESQGLG